jgi:hypothetical protein
MAPIPEMGPLAVDTLAPITEMGQIAVDTPATTEMGPIAVDTPATTDMGPLAVDTLAPTEMGPLASLRSFLGAHELAVDNLPWTFTRTPTTAYPGALTPYPIASDPRVVVVWVALEAGYQLVPASDEPGVASVEIVLVDRPISIVGGLLGIIGNGAPEIGNVAISIIDGPGDIGRTRKEHSQ